MIGVSLLLRHPDVAALSCADCQKYIITADWKIDERAGKKLLRPANVGPPCMRCPKLSAKDRRDDPRPENAIELSSKNWKAYLHYLEVKAGAEMPNDPMTRRNCAMIKMVEDDFERDRTDVTPLIHLLAERA